MTNLQPGQTLGPFRITGQIGEGGMATVYKAYQPSMDRTVAIKVLPSQLSNNAQFVGRFQQEARIIARLEHPHILPVFDSGESDGIYYLVMRYLEAGTLTDKMSGPLSMDDIDRIFSQLADALGYAHSQGVIHRDLKPSNALIDKHGNLFLTDFGIAKILEGTSQFTKTDMVMGTPAYISPEQAQGSKVDQRSDIYSLGIILYEMITGRLPFVADTPLAVIYKHINDPLPLPSTVNKQISSAVENVILKALAKSPDDRFKTADEFLSAWKNAVKNNVFNPRDSKSTGTIPPTVVINPQGRNNKKPSRTMLMIILACVCFVCLAVAGLLIFLNRDSFNVGGIALGGPSENQFPISIGDEVASDDTGSGKGVIETPGSKDIYTFTASPGQKVYIQIIEEPDTVGNISFVLTDDTGSNVFASCLQCGDPGSTTLDRGGEYSLVVGNDDATNQGSGPYHFKIWDVPAPQVFPINLSEPITKDNPGTGAGFIETPGALDVYTFALDSTQDVYFQVKEQPSTSALIGWQVTDEVGNVKFDTCLQCGDPGLVTLDAGSYTITVGTGNNHGTGSYQIVAWSVAPPQEFEIKIGDSVSFDQPAPGAGNISSPGEFDIYTFTASAGQTIALSIEKAPNTTNLMNWKLVGEDGTEFFNNCMECGDPEPITFSQAGTYQIIVGSETNPGTGEYEFKLFKP